MLAWLPLKITHEWRLPHQMRWGKVHLESVKARTPAYPLYVSQTARAFFRSSLNIQHLKNRTTTEFVRKNDGLLKVTTYEVNEYPGCQCYRRDCACQDKFVPYVHYRVRKMWGNHRTVYGTDRDLLISLFWLFMRHHSLPVARWDRSLYANFVKFLLALQ